jgi:hypothetical protein
VTAEQPAAVELQGQPVRNLEEAIAQAVASDLRRTTNPERWQSILARIAAELGISPPN